MHIKNFIFQEDLFVLEVLLQLPNLILHVPNHFSVLTVQLQRATRLIFVPVAIGARSRLQMIPDSSQAHLNVP